MPAKGVVVLAVAATAAAAAYMLLSATRSSGDETATKKKKQKKEEPADNTDSSQDRGLDFDEDGTSVEEDVSTPEEQEDREIVSSTQKDPVAEKPAIEEQDPLGSSWVNVKEAKAVKSESSTAPPEQLKPENSTIVERSIAEEHTLDADTLRKEPSPNDADGKGELDARPSKERKVDNADSKQREETLVAEVSNNTETASDETEANPQDEGAVAAVAKASEPHTEEEEEASCDGTLGDGGTSPSRKRRKRKKKGKNVAISPASKTTEEQQPTDVAAVLKAKTAKKKPHKPAKNLAASLAAKELRASQTTGKKKNKKK